MLCERNDVCLHPADLDVGFIRGKGIALTVIIVVDKGLDVELASNSGDKGHIIPEKREVNALFIADFPKNQGFKEN